MTRAAIRDAVGDLIAKVRVFSKRLDVVCVQATIGVVATPPACVIVPALHGSNPGQVLSVRSLLSGAMAALPIPMVLARQLWVLLAPVCCADFRSVLSALWLTSQAWSWHASLLERHAPIVFGRQSPAFPRMALDVLGNVELVDTCELPTAARALLWLWSLLPRLKSRVMSVNESLWLSFDVAIGAIGFVCYRRQLTTSALAVHAPILAGAS